MLTKSLLLRPVQILSAALIFLLHAGALPAQNPVRFVGQPGSKVRLEGTSTIHDWTMDGGIIGGFLELDSGFSTDPAATDLKPGKVTATASARIPVRSIKSGKTRMDEVMQEHMKEKDFPRIEYRLTEMVLKETPGAGAPLKFDTKGELTVAGVTNKVSMPITMERIDKSKVKIIGSTGLKMSDFKVEPVAIKIPALGSITTGDDVKISFEWITATRAETAEKTQ
jgi:polyisoprenoid-binding protein YceI